MVTLVCSWEHFPERRGLVTGIIEAAYGLGSFIFAQISSRIVNPNNDQPTILVIDGETTLHYFAPNVANNVSTLKILFNFYY